MSFAAMAVWQALLLVGAAGAAAWWLFRINLKKFEREEILTRWV